MKEDPGGVSPSGPFEQVRRVSASRRRDITDVTYWT